jgi:hypothetical protein
LNYTIAGYKREIDQIPIQKAHLEAKERDFELEKKDYETSNDKIKQDQKTKKD